METAVRKATRLEYRPPKPKHLITLRDLTFDNPASIDGILACLEKRLKEHSWIITYKVLTILHYLMRQGNCVRVVDAIIKRPSVLDASKIKNKSSSPANVQNIYLYRAYLDERIIAFRHLRRDYVKEASSKGEGRLRHLRIEDGLLKETAALQRQTESVLKCKFYLGEKDPSITFFAYKMAVEDLLALFQVVNEGVVNILEHYFEMDKSNATTALNIYKTFAQQTELTIDYLSEARKLENEMELNIPSIKHAPLSLASALEEYLKDADNQANNNKKTEQNQKVPPPPIVTQQQQQQQQQQQLPFIQSPAQQQQLASPSVFQPVNNLQPQQSYQIQNAPFNNNIPSDAVMDAAFSTLNRRPTQQSNMMATSSLARSSTVASTTNPFLNMTNQQPTDNTFMTNNFNSPYATIGHAPAQGYAAISNTPTIAFASSTVAAPSTASIIGNNYFQSLNLNSSNTNRTALSTIDFGTSNSSNLNPNIPVAKPMVVPQATGSVFHSNRNPFSPVTPPLTPNQPNNLFMSLPSTTSPVSRNPFSQQNFPNHTTTMNQQFQSSAF